jgi:hypothetical protein
MSKHRRKSHECKNCGYTWPSAPDEFCPSCGQENTDLNIPLKHWILEFIEAIFHVDGKLGVTLKYLFLKPGKMSVEFTEGRRMKFIPPARLYIFVSFFFFLALSTMHYDDALTGVVDLTEPELDKPWEEVSINVFGENTIGLAGLNASRREVRRAYLKGTEALDSLFAKGGLQFDGSLDRGFWHQAAKIETLGPSTFREKLMKLFSLGAFLLMPVYAGLLALFFRRRTWFTAHAVLSVHSHILLFTGFTLSIAAIHLDQEWLFYLIVSYLAVMHFLSLRNFYGNPWPGVAWRYILLTAIYLLLLLAFLIGAVMLTFVLV